MQIKKGDAFGTAVFYGLFLWAGFYGLNEI